MLLKNCRRRDSFALTKGLPIAVRRLCRTELALSVTCGDSFPKGRGFSIRAAYVLHIYIALKLYSA